MKAEYEIIIEHDAPISLSVLSDIHLEISRVLEDVALDFFNEEIFPGIELSEREKDEILDQIKAQSNDLVWVNSIEPGSTRIKGVLIGVALWAVVNIGGGFIVDAIKGTETYKTAVQEASKHTDNFLNKLKNGINRRREYERDENKPILIAEVEGQKVTIRVIPAARQMNMPPG